jgi:hypothetical protein
MPFGFRLGHEPVVSVPLRIPRDIRRDPPRLVCVIKLDREELGRMQEASCRTHLNLAHFRFQRPTDFV